MNIIKWICFGIMLSGALVTSLQPDTIIGVELLFVGNVAWLITAIYSKYWPSAANFSMLASIWLLGVIK